MDEKVSLARQEEVGRSELLYDPGIREVSKNAPCGEEGQTQLSNAEGNEGGKVSNTAQKSKGNAEAKSRGRKRGRKSGRVYSLRETIREAERRDKPFRRSAEELGIEWLDVRCEESPKSKAHYLVGRTEIDKGIIFECKFCHKVVWLPGGLDDAVELRKLFQIYGFNKGYQKMLDKHSAAKRMLSKIQDIYYLRKATTSEQFPVAMAAVMMDKEYPYDVEIKEEDIL